jgi:hypothetical protein
VSTVIPLPSISSNLLIHPHNPQRTRGKNPALQSLTICGIYLVLYRLISTIGRQLLTKRRVKSHLNAHF